MQCVSKHFVKTLKGYWQHFEICCRDKIGPSGDQRKLLAELNCNRLIEYVFVSFLGLLCKTSHRMIYLIAYLEWEIIVLISDVIDRAYISKIIWRGLKEKNSKTYNHKV